jgi:deoxyribodipyrimidine photolyase-related protein
VEITLVYPHQLFAEHPAIQRGRGVALIEDPLFFGTDPCWPIKVHCQRVLLHRLSMTAYADDLRQKGFSVHIQRHDSAVDTNGHLGLLLAAGYRRFYIADPVDHLLEKRLMAFIDDNNCQLVIEDTPLLLTPKSVIEKHFVKGKKPLMAKFYEMQRKRLNILIDADGSPRGGQWSFDADNRKKLPKGIIVPPVPVSTPCGRSRFDAGAAENGTITPSWRWGSIQLSDQP